MVLVNRYRYGKGIGDISIDPVLCWFKFQFLNNSTSEVHPQDHSARASAISRRMLEAGVAGAKDERKGEVVKAFVALKPNEKATEEDLLLHCRGLLAPYKGPRTVEFRTELPKGPTGKVQRRLLK